MNRLKIVAFDIETANTEESISGDLSSLRPLGITCATALANDIDSPFVWHGKSDSGTPTAKMTREEACVLVQDLKELVSKGYTIVTWNGAGFDFDILAEESGLYSECAQLAIEHIDMLFHVLCALGYRVGLQRAAEGMGLRGKTEGMCGLEAPKKWAAGEYTEVIDYCVQDVRVTLNVALECEKRRTFKWITSRGQKRSLPLDKGWLTVRDSMHLPVPDTSWMTDAPKRSDSIGWLNSHI